MYAKVRLQATFCYQIRFYTSDSRCTLFWWRLLMKLLLVEISAVASTTVASTVAANALQL